MLNALVTAIRHPAARLEGWPGKATDSYREHPGDFDQPAASETPPANDVAAAIGTDERRMHVRAYNHWVALLAGRDFPSIEDLEPSNVSDFAAHSVLLDFTCGGETPAIPYVGAALRDECGLDEDTRTIADVPSRSLLSRLTDHYMQIIANRAPVGFEAEFENPRGESICYRGILMPFSSDGEAIDFIYGVINWKHVADAADDDRASAQTAAVEAEIVEIAPDSSFEDDQPFELAEAVAEDEQPFELTEQVAEGLDPEPVASGIAAVEGAAPPHFSWEDGPL